MSRLAARQVATHLLRSESGIQQCTDAELLAQFAATHDESAFAEIVARHGALVRGVARRWVRDIHAAEDVYQAAFLVLASKAGMISWRGTVGPWLYTTTTRLARKSSRRTRPVSVTPQTEAVAPDADPAARLAWAESYRALDEELAELPEKLRAPLVLCYLQGHTRDEAAQMLGCSLAMLKRRLERARAILHHRLTRRGVTLPAIGVGLLVCDLADVNAVQGTSRAAVAFVARGTAPPGAAALIAGSRSTFSLKVVSLIAAGVMAVSVAFASFVWSENKTPDSSANPPAAAKSEEKAEASPLSDPLPPSAVVRLGSDRLRIGGRVDRLVFSPDGTQMASVESDYQHTTELVIWDTKTGRALRHINLPGVGVFLLTWLADGRGIALVQVYDDSAPLLWEFTSENAPIPKGKRPNLTGGTFSAPVQPVQDNVYDACYAISPDGKMLAIGKSGQLQQDREVQLWELQVGVRTNTLKPLKGGVIHPGNCGEIYFTPDAKTLVVFTQAKYLDSNEFENKQLVTVWDVKTSKERTRFTAPRPATNGRPAVALSNTTLAIGLAKGDTSLWDLKTGKEQRLDTKHVNQKIRHFIGTYSVAFTPDGKTLITGGQDNAVKVWDLESRKLVRTLTGHHSWVDSLAVASNGRLLASTGGTIRLWDLTTGADVCPLPGHKFVVWHVALSADGKSAITGSWDNTLRWWDATTGTERRSMPINNGMTSLVPSPDGKIALVATDDGKLRMWDGETGREKPTNLPADAKFEVLSFSPDGKHLVAASGSKVTLWEWPSLKLARTIELPKPSKSKWENPPPVNGQTRCHTAIVSPDGKWLVTVAERAWTEERDGATHSYSGEGVVDVWEFATGKRVRRLAAGLSSFRTGLFTADGQFVLAGGEGTIIQPDGSEGEAFTGTINLFDLTAGRVVHRFEPPHMPDGVVYRNCVCSVLSPDGRTLCVSYMSGEIVLFEVETGRVRRTFTGHRAYVSGLGFSADGRRLISGCYDGTALVWDTSLTGAATPRSKPFSAAEVDKLWQAIEADDSKAAFAAMVQLATSPDQAVDIIRRQVKPPSASTEAGTRLRQVRAVELLEGLGTPAAKKLLNELAAGATNAPLTFDASAALKRLGKR